MIALNRLAATVGCLAMMATAFTATGAHADGRRTVQTETGVIVADYRTGNIPPADAIVVRPGQRWQGWLELDHRDTDIKYYIANPNAAPGDRPWRHYWARHVECGEPSEEDYAFVTVTVAADGRATIRCRID